MAPAWIALGIVLSFMPHDMLYGPQAALIAECFAPRLRYSGSSIGLQLASITGGGPAPIIATALLAWTGSGYAIAVYIALCGLVSIIATVMMPDYEARYAEGHADRLGALAADLVRLKVDVIVTAGSPAAEAAKEATAAVPIVLWGAGDPIGIGLVTDVSHPGGNKTGVTELSTELTAKRLQLFKETVPGLKRMAVIWNAGDHAMSLRFREVEAAAPGLGLGVMPLPIQALDDFDASFEVMARDRPDGILVVSDAMTRLKEGALFEFARSQRLPTMFEFPPSAHDGGLISYGPSLAELAPRAAAFVDKILKGAKPGDLPLESPVHWHLVVNLRTAKAIGVAVPPAILARADEVIE